MIRMKNGMRRYDLFGWDYEFFNPLSKQETAWYLRWARRTGGPILELATGTGRLLLEIAKAGYEIDGIDLSKTMLDLAQGRIAVQPPDIQSRIRLHRMDMSSFALDHEYGLIIIADNSFRELKETNRQRSFLKCVHKHLRSDGKFLMTERRFDISHLYNGCFEYPWSATIRNPDTGDLVRRKILLNLAPDEKSIRGIMAYEINHPNGAITVDECPYDAPLMQREEYLALLTESGFSPIAYTDYREKPAKDEHSVVCFVSSKR
jgi:SAM-dependent methyltransferase